jgi:alpha-beta hydrolase superfamily lysophospholipase
MVEQACQFGEGGHLTGIISEPSGRAPRAVCVLVSAGLVPKFGPYRLYTFLARRLASRDVAVLRFDLGGIGDSAPLRTGEPVRIRTDREIAAAVALVHARYPDAHITLAGLCSGAEDSLRYAEKDHRVRGVVMIDPFSYPTSGWRWRHMRYRIIRRAMRVLGAYKPRRPVSAPNPGPGGGKVLIEYRYMPPDESRRIVSHLLGRGVHMHFIYTGGVRETFNHQGQLQKMFPGLDFAGRVSIDYIPDITHTQLLEEDRSRLASAAEAWFSRVQLQ